MEKNLNFFRNILQNAQLMYCDLRFLHYELFYLPLLPFILPSNATTIYQILANNSTMLRYLKITRYLAIIRSNIRSIRGL